MTTRRITSTLCLSALLVAVAAQLPAQTAHPVLSGFLPIDDYILEVDGQTDSGARLYLSQRAASMLILSDSLGEPILLWARSMAVDRLQSSDLLASGPGYDVVAEPDKSYIGDAIPDQTTIVLPIEGRDVKVLPRPPLIGDRTLGELLEHSPGYRAGMDAFQPNAAAMAALRDAQPARVRVFFGTWCGVCKQVLPNLLEVNAGLEGTQLTFEYYGLASPPGGWEDPEVTGSEVTGLPTAIIYRDGREVGRFGGANDFAQPAQVLQALLAGSR
ncbi:MAG: thioredoxin family protein [Acidobacteriota bacterium]|nr:thioredoxin family protein [Acidobacteriota bacterium]MDE3263958.1 thioredoxin family protein [Acidobacteriota bacterium]